MEELSRVARNVGEAVNIRRAAQNELTLRESAFKTNSRYTTPFKCFADYVPS